MIGLEDKSRFPLHDFVEQLLQEGRAITRGQLHQRPSQAADREATAESLRRHETDAANDAPYTTPLHNVEASVWSAQAFAWAAGILIDRGESEVKIPNWLDETRPLGLDPSEHWSVDLVFRLMPDLVRRSEKIAKGDPFNDELSQLLAPWPLACVGTSIENPRASICVVMENDCLRTMYVDRILLRADSRRVEDETVQPWVQRVVGDYPNLAKGIA